MDLFGHGAKARVKALEEALDRELKRNEELTRQVLALSDRRALQVLGPRTQRGVMQERTPMAKPLDSPRSPEDAIRVARDWLKAKDIKPGGPQTH